ATDTDGALDYSNILKGRRIFTPRGGTIPEKQTQVSAFDINELDEVYGGELVNLVRKEVGLWRVARYPNVTRVTNDLLRFWFLNDERLVTQNLFFAQQEALEIAIWLNEVAYKSNAGQFILDQLHKSHQSVSDDINAQLP